MGGCSNLKIKYWFDKYWVEQGTPVQEVQQCLHGSFSLCMILWVVEMMTLFFAVFFFLVM